MYEVIDSSSRYNCFCCKSFVPVKQNIKWDYFISYLISICSRKLSMSSVRNFSKIFDSLQPRNVAEVAESMSEQMNKSLK